MIHSPISPLAVESFDSDGSSRRNRNKSQDPPIPRSDGHKGLDTRSRGHENESIVALAEFLSSHSPPLPRRRGGHGGGRGSEDNEIPGRWDHFRAAGCCSCGISAKLRLTRVIQYAKWAADVWMRFSRPRLDLRRGKSFPRPVISNPLSLDLDRQGVRKDERNRKINGETTGGHRDAECNGNVMFR